MIELLWAAVPAEAKAVLLVAVLIDCLLLVWMLWRVRSR